MRDIELGEINPESFQTSSDPPMQGYTQECHQEDCCQCREDQGGDEPGVKV